MFKNILNYTAFIFLFFSLAVSVFGQNKKKSGVYIKVGNETYEIDSKDLENLPPGMKEAMFKSGDTLDVDPEVLYYGPAEYIDMSFQKTNSEYLYRDANRSIYKKKYIPDSSKEDFILYNTQERSCRYYRFRIIL